jgi:hypothetical protein
VWRLNYIETPFSEYDPSNPAHTKGYVQIIMFFKCDICPTKGAEQHMLAFVEELWPYTPPTSDLLHDEYGCSILYSTHPHPAYYVVPIDSILGPAAIMRDPCTPTILPHGLRGVSKRNPSAVCDKIVGDKGSRLYRLNAFCMQWGDKYLL